MLALPISGARIRFQEGTGADDLFLAEGETRSIAFRVDVARRYVQLLEADTSWDDLPYADVDAALLGLRRQRHGDRLSTEILCRACASRGQVTLSIGRYLADSRQAKPRHARREADGTWCWRDLRFRIPLVRDVVEHLRGEGPTEAAARAIARACAPAASTAELTRIGGLLDRIAPPLARMVKGTCPECGEAIEGWFDPGAVVLDELQAKARTVFEQVHLLASRYRWSEQAILAMPTRRRRSYAAFIEGVDA